MNTEYKAIKFHLVPLTGFKKYFIFDEIDNYLPYAIDNNATIYTKINLQKCKSLSNFKICEITSPIYRTNVENCMTNLIFYKKKIKIV